MNYPRVTEILRAYSNFDQVPIHILDRAAARGVSVHAICAGISKGAWIPDGMIGQEHIGYVNSFKQWAKAQVSEFVIIEKRYADDEKKYTGQLDSVILAVDKELYLVDLKTSSRKNKTYRIQMAAYHLLLKKHNVKVKGAMIVYLDKDGEFPDIDLLEDMSEEERVFESALHCWHYFNKGKKNEPKDRGNSSTTESTIDSGQQLSSECA